jgi:DNA-binding CsgD family transcriptional regulator
MKVAAMLTSRVMDSVCKLPGVATIDWCDRAAAAMCRLHHPAVAFVSLVTLDTRGFVLEVETAGASSSTHAAPSAADVFSTIDRLRDASPPVAHSESPTDPNLVMLRDSLNKGDWIGWSIGALQEGLWHLASAAPQGLLGAGNPGPMFRRWSRFSPVDVIVAACAIPGTKPGRWLVLEIGSSDPSFRDNSREQAALAACLPMLAQKLYGAFGKEPVNVHASLTPREQAVLWRLVAGMKVPQIAEELDRSMYTVHDHVKALHRKLNAKSRGELVAKALGHLGAGHDHPVPGTVGGK